MNKNIKQPTNKTSKQPLNANAKKPATGSLGKQPLNKGNSPYKGGKESDQKGW